MSARSVQIGLSNKAREYLLSDFFTFCKMTGTIAPIYEQPHREMCRELEACMPDFESNRQKKKLYLAPRRTYKALDVDTPIATTKGFRRMGDLAVGDQVFSETGLPTTIIGVSDVYHGRPCYEVLFSTGETIVADEDHLWSTSTRFDRDCGRPEPTVKTTAQIRDSIMCRDERNHRIETSRPVQFPAADLLVPPYTLGVWLGDGATASASITCADPEMVEFIRAEGVPIRYAYIKSDPYKYVLNSGRGGKRADTTQHKLRELGVLGNKHIPEAYLTASVQQRRELLRGLMDSDGSCSKREGACIFVNTNLRLVEQVKSLAASLGYKPSTIGDYPSSLYGKDCGRHYRVTFKAYAGEDAPFKLPRKIANLKPMGNWRLKHRQIVSVTPVVSRPVKCIMVDASSSLYLAGRSYIPTHNTSLIAAFIVYVILKYQNIRIALGRSVHAKAIDILREVKQKMTGNPVILDVFGDLSKNAPLWNEQAIIVNTRTVVSKDPTVSTFGLDVSLTGTHPDMIFGDDFVDETNYTSAKMQAKARLVIQSVLPALEPWGSLILSGTRWGANDAYGWVIRQDDELEEAGEARQWDLYIRGAFDGPDGYYFPAVITKEFLAQMRGSVDPKLYASWYLNQTHEEGVKLFTRFDYFEAEFYANPDPVLVEETDEGEVTTPVRVSMTIDGAMLSNDRNDLMGVVVNAVDADDQWNILEAQGFRKVPTEQASHVLYLIRAYLPEVVQVENAGSDALFMTRLGAGIADINNEYGVNIAVQSYSAVQQESRGRRGKAQRIEALQPRFNGRDGTIRFRRGHCQELVREADAWPNPEHDDVLDALAMQKHAAQPARFRSTLAAFQAHRDQMEEAEEAMSWGPEGKPAPPPPEPGKRAFAQVGIGSQRLSA